VTAIIIDTETTCVVDPDVLQLAYLSLVKTFTGSPASLVEVDRQSEVLAFKPRKPISLGAMATHHIIEEDVAHCSEWVGTWLPPTGTEYLIGHNIDFDWQAIGAPPLKRICTLALARKLWPTIDSHSLSALIYHLMPHHAARDLLKSAHQAHADAWLCHRVLLAELALMPAIASWERLHAASEKARVPTHFTFGKYGPQAGQPGIAIAEVRAMDPSYIDWCLRSCDQCQDEYWQRALKGQV
jgi:exodeoxyribonuclease X